MKPEKLVKIWLILFIAFFMVSCNSTNKNINKAALLVEIAATEKSFETAVKEKGIAYAFAEFADENAVINRGNDSLIKGKESIRNYYQHPRYKNASVSWKPDFIDVSGDGELAYTFGKYEWLIVDSLSSKATTYKGIFHTVWKKQNNGSWKYVWD